VDLNAPSVDIELWEWPRNNAMPLHQQDVLLNKLLMLLELLFTHTINRLPNF